jgi:hypothetical protein
LSEHFFTGTILTILIAGVSSPDISQMYVAFVGDKFDEEDMQKSNAVATTVQ